MRIALLDGAPQLGEVVHQPQMIAIGWRAR
jgi:hypothetical protein